MRTYLLFFFVSIFCKISSLSKLSPDIRSDDLKCINYFLSNLTNFSRQSHFVLLLTNATKSSKLENDFLDMQIRSRAISLKMMDHDVKRNFDSKSAYIIFLPKNEFEHLVELFSKAKGLLHVVFQLSDFFAEDQFETTFLQMAYRAQNNNSELSSFVHVNFNKKWKLFKIAQNQNTSKLEILSIGECHLSETEAKLEPKNITKSQLLRVKSPHIPPFASSFKRGEFSTGIDVKLMRLISEKLRKEVQFDFLNVSSYNEVLQGMVHGNLSETFLM